MLVLTPKYGSQIDLDLLKKQKEQKPEPLIKHRLTIDLNQCKDMNEAYLVFLNNKDNYIIGYKPKKADEINTFAWYLDKIDTLDVSWIDVSELNSLARCFENCEIKHIIGLEKWNVSNVKDIWGMFRYCEIIESIGDISGWDVSKIESMDSMFDLCKNLESIGDISGWDVSNVELMADMFKGCYRLTSIGDISGWDVSNVRNMNSMFENCAYLESIGDIERWKLHSNVLLIDTFAYSGIIPRPSWYTNMQIYL